MEPVSTADSDRGCIRFSPAEGATEPIGGKYLNESASQSAPLVFSDCRISSLERSGARTTPWQPMGEMPRWSLRRDLFRCSGLVTWDSSLELGRFVG
jgi:hypothetical protein